MSEHKNMEGATGETQEMREKQPGEAAATETKEGYIEDMNSYGPGYNTRSEDEGFGQIYGNPATEGAIGRHGNAPAEWAVDKDEVDQTKDPGTTEYDRTQGEPVAQREHGRHAERDSAATSQPHPGAEHQTGMAT